MDEVYLRPEEVLFSTVSSVLISLIISAAIRPSETEGGVMEVREIVGYSTSDLANALEVMESSMAMGKKARISIYTEALPNEADLAQMYLDMTANEYHLSYPIAKLVEGIPTTEFVLRKGSPAWPALIPLIVPVLIVGLVAFSVTRIEAISKALVPLVLVTVGGLIILAVVLQKPATKYIERGGKIPLLPAASKKVLAAR